MLDQAWASLLKLVDLGGWVMWPLLGLSILALTLITERFWFWLRNNGLGAQRRLRAQFEALRTGDLQTAGKLATADDTVYSRMTAQLAALPGDESAAVDAVETQRPRLERFMPTLSTIITVAPMLGILGTVIGIIRSFSVFAQQSRADLDAVSGGIAQALWSTAAGLVVAMLVLFPYNAFRSQIDRTLGRLELLAAAGRRLPENTESQPPTSEHQTVQPALSGDGKKSSRSQGGQ